jgi:hypothetical protein
MLRRAFTLFLAVLLSWSAFATQEGSLQAGQGFARAVMESVPADTGSVDQHHLDDQPGQALAEAGADMPEWFAMPRLGLVLTAAGGKPRAAPGAAPAAVVLDAPRRPPRA